MKPTKIEAAFPLSPQQQGMLYASLGEQGSGLFVEQFTCRIQGGLNINLFREAWQRLIDAHSMLRTAFVWKAQKEPIQVVLKDVELRFQRQDLRAFSEEEQQLRVEAFLGIDSQQPFKLAEAPLMRLALLQLADDQYHFVWTIHHILIDGWCRPVILNQLQEIYCSLAAGEKLRIVSSRPYRDYVLWLQKRDLPAAEAFWRQELAGFREATELGRTTDSQSPARDFSEYAVADNHLSEATTVALQELAKSHGITLNTILQGVWALVLARYSGKDDLVFGTTVSGRPADLDGASEMIGLFINTLPFRVQVAKEAPLFEWLKQLQAKHAQIRNYEYCSSGQVQEWSEIPRNRVLYEAILVFQNYPAVMPTFTLSDGIEVKELRSAGAKTEYPLTLLAGRPGNSGIGLRAVYDRSRFTSTAMASALEHVSGPLSSIAASPQQRVAALMKLIPDNEIPIVFPRTQARSMHAEFVAPRNAIEEVITSIWAECLGLAEVSVTANFFALGGHSLAAAHLLNAVTSKLGVHIPLRTLFESPTPAGMASVVVQQIASTAEPETVNQVLNEIESGD